MKRMVRDPDGDTISWGNFRRSPGFTSALTYLKERYKAHLQSQAEKKSEVTISSQPLGAMVNLRLLQINNVNLEGNFKFLPAELKWLQWKCCPLRSLPFNFLPPQLAVLDLSDSTITSLSGEGSVIVCFSCLTCSSGHKDKVYVLECFLLLNYLSHPRSSPQKPLHYCDSKNFLIDLQYYMPCISLYNPTKFIYISYTTVMQFGHIYL